MESETNPIPQHHDLAEAISHMCEVDQEMRERSIVDPQSWDESIDPVHTSRMREIIDSVGWPTVDGFGPDASHNAWLLVQHADKDVPFQERCLALMKSAAPGDVSLRDIAYLEDRIRANRGLPQIYGTQFQNFVLRPIEDPETVDDRRKAMGLSSLAEGIEDMERRYAPLRPK